MILVRDSYSGAFSSISFVQSVDEDLTINKKKRRRPNKRVSKPRVEMELGLQITPSPLYSQKLPIAKAKLKDFMDLKKFLPEKAQEFYNNLLPAGVEEESDDDERFG